VDEGWITRNPLEKLRRPRLPKPVIEILSDEEIGRIISSINPKCLFGARLYTIVLLLLDTGIRASELCSLTLEDVHLNEGYIKVFGKGSKERIVPFGNSTKKALLRWLVTWRDEMADGTDALFSTNGGYQLTYKALCKSIKRLGVRNDVPRLHAHLFRHTFAVEDVPSVVES
jgi:site-specific recombinase XerD